MMSETIEPDDYEVTLKLVISARQMNLLQELVGEATADVDGLNARYSCQAVRARNGISIEEFVENENKLPKGATLEQIAKREKKMKKDIAWMREYESNRIWIGDVTVPCLPLFEEEVRDLEAALKAAFDADATRKPLNEN
jgi:hypothetical protein